MRREVKELRNFQEMDEFFLLAKIGLKRFDKSRFLGGEIKKERPRATIKKLSS